MEKAKRRMMPALKFIHIKGVVSRIGKTLGWWKEKLMSVFITYRFTKYY